MEKLLNYLFKVSKTEYTYRWYVLSTKFLGIKIHKILPKTDEWHTHPWNGVSIIIGSYFEQLEDITNPWIKKKIFNIIKANKKHRTFGNCYTLFIHGPRINENWYWGDKIKPWRGPQNNVK